jgi:hypothetical protein
MRRCEQHQLLLRTLHGDRQVAGAHEAVGPALLHVAVANIDDFSSADRAAKCCGGS